MFAYTSYCDGSSDPVYYIKEAIKMNLPALGYSSHAPLSFPCNWTIPIQFYPSYLDTIKHLKDIYANKLEIYCGLEIDFIPDLWNETKVTVDIDSLDYFIGSIHFIDSFEDGRRWGIDGSNLEFRKGLSDIFNNDIHAVIRKYFAYTRQMVKDMKPSIIGHIDKIKMQSTDQGPILENDPVFREELYYTLEEIAISGCIIEINTRGVYKRKEQNFYPGTWALKQMSELNIPVIISSDAHRPEELTNHFALAVENLKTAGYKCVISRKNNQWINLDIDHLHLSKTSSSMTN